MQKNIVSEEKIKHAIEKCRSSKKVIFRKINLANLILTICSFVTKESPSFKEIALEYSLRFNTTISKQAIGNFFLKNVLSEILSNLIQEILYDKLHINNEEIAGIFNRILLHDSTNIKLPNNADNKFSGMNNQSKEGKACKIQTFFDIISNTFTFFELTPYRVNDQKYSHKLSTIINKNDLIIRDLGYFVVGSLKKITETGAFFISKIKITSSFYNRKGEKIDLLHLLEHNDQIDEIVYLTKKEKLKVRIIARRVTEETGNLRRFRLKKDKRNNPSKQSLTLLGWDIIVTNIIDIEIKKETIFDLYNLRWKIELIFKTWKSNFSLSNFHYGISQIQINVYIAARLLILTILHVHFVRCIFNKQRKYNKTQISYISFMKNLSLYIKDIIFYSSRKKLEKIINEVIRFSKYEKRKKRKNYLEYELATLHKISYKAITVM